MTTQLSGRELDAFIAERLMGYERTPVPRDAHGENAGETLTPPGLLSSGWQWAPTGAYPLHAFVPKYSTDIKAAWEVMERLRKTGEIVSLNWFPDAKEWERTVHLGPPHITAGAAPEAAEAICLAAQLYVEVRDA